MRTDNRLFRILHALLHMARDTRVYTSEELAKMLSTNAVIVRRTMASLREEGYVHSEKGHGGGWQLSCDLDKVTLLDIYQAVGKPTIFNIGVSDSQSDCMIEKVVNDSISEAMNEAESLILKKFGDTKLSKLGNKLDKLLPGNSSSSRHKR